MTTSNRRFALAGVVVALLAAVGLGTYFVAADGRPKEAAKGVGKGPQAVLITATTVQPRSLEIYEEVIGTLENIIDPTIGAEVAGRVTRVAGFTGKKVTKGEVIAEIDAVDFEIQSRGDQAEIGRLNSLLDQQQRVVERQQKLVSQGFISQNAVDDAIAQRNALREQLAAARARAEATGRSLTKSKVVAPVDGEIETQVVAVGDYVKLGDPLFKLVGVQEMRAHLLLP
ncbi:MAG TPA: efflux RND transporter periplasmic adaptor subunit, partial [Burkholderiales bacterium]